MSANRSTDVVYEASLGACLGLAAQILEPGMAQRDVCQKEVLGPMILAAHRFGQQHVKQVASVADKHNPRKILYELQHDTLQGNNQVAPGSAIDLATITFGDISWDFHGDVAQTLEMELLDITGRVEEVKRNACVLLSVSSPDLSRRDVETAVVWLPRTSNSHSKVAGRFLLYVYPGRAKVVKSVAELVKKLHEELSVANERDARYNVWTLMENENQSQEKRGSLSPHELQPHQSPIRNGGQTPKNSAKSEKMRVISREPEIDTSMFTFQRNAIDLGQKISPSNARLPGSEQTIRSQSSVTIKETACEKPETTSCNHASDSSQHSPMNHRKHDTKSQGPQPKRQSSQRRVVSLSYADPRILKANESTKSTVSVSSDVCKSVDRPFEARYLMPLWTYESHEPEQKEDVYDEEITNANASANRLQWQNEAHHERTKATPSQNTSPLQAAQSSIFGFSARPSNQELAIAAQTDPVSETGTTKSINKDFVLSVASNDHEPTNPEDSHISNCNEEEELCPPTEMDQRPCSVQEQKPLRSACANYKAKLGARVWWELQYQAQKLQSQSSKQSNSSQLGQFTRLKPPSVATSPSMRETTRYCEPNQRKSAIKSSSAALFTVEETENYCDQVSDDTDQGCMLVTEICEISPSSSTNTVDVGSLSLWPCAKDDPSRKSISKNSDYDDSKTIPIAARVSFQSPSIQAKTSVNHSITDSISARWAQSSSLTAGSASVSQSARGVNGSRSSQNSSRQSPLKWYEIQDNDEDDDEEVVYTKNDVEEVGDHDMTVQLTSVSAMHEWNEAQDPSRKSSFANYEEVTLHASLIDSEPQRSEVWNDYCESEASVVSITPIIHDDERSPFASPNSPVEDHEEDDISRWQMTSSNAPYMIKRELEPTWSKPSFIQQGHVPIRGQSLQEDTQTKYYKGSSVGYIDEPPVSSYEAVNAVSSSIKPVKENAPAPTVLTVEMDDIGSTEDARQARQKRLAELRQKKLLQLQRARKEAISSRQKQRMGPTQALATNDSDRGSITSFSNSNKNYRPTQAKRPSNRQLIQNALEFTLLAGGSMEKERTAALAALAQSSCDNFLVLLKSAKDMKFRALYQVDRQHHDEVQRIFSVSTGAPQTLTSEAIGQFFKYNSGNKTFLPVETRSFTVKTDACALQERLILKRQQNLARLL